MRVPCLRGLRDVVLEARESNRRWRSERGALALRKTGADPRVAMSTEETMRR